MTRQIEHAPPARSADEIRDWLTRYLARLLDLEESSIDLDAPFQRFGVDSSAAVGMTGDLEEWLGFEVDPTLPYDYPTIESLSQHLAGESSGHWPPDEGSAA